jgi:hypothetical protein
MVIHSVTVERKAQQELAAQAAEDGDRCPAGQDRKLIGPAASRTGGVQWMTARAKRRRRLGKRQVM